MESIDSVIEAGPFQPNWDSLKAYKVPAWYEDAKFGIFIHWGIYSVPAFRNEWYPRNMYQQGTEEFAHHVATYGPQNEFGYKDFIPQFTAAKFDANEWAALFQEAGARFVVPVAEHHDGFPMYATDRTEWCAAKMGPKRDVIGELSKSVRAAGMTFGVSSHRAENWFFFDGGKTFPSDVQDPRNSGLYGLAQTKPKDQADPNSPERPDDSYLQDWLERTCELVDKYQPQIVWFDWWIQHQCFKPYIQKFGAYYYNRGSQWGPWDTEGVAINYKYGAFEEGTAVFDIERGQLSGIREQLWQNDTSVSKSSWCYTENQQYKTVDSLIDDLVDIVSKNGVLLLNIGPKPDGTIPEEEQQMLREIGEWLEINGEAIYETRPWKIFGEGPTKVAEGAFTDTKRGAFTSEDVRFTTKGDTLYAILLGWPGSQAVIRSLGTASGLLDKAIVDIHLLGHDSPLEWSRTAEALTVNLPESAPCDHAYSLKITFS